MSFHKYSHKKTKWQKDLFVSKFDVLIICKGQRLNNENEIKFNNCLWSGEGRPLGHFSSSAINYFFYFFTGVFQMTKKTDI